MMKNMKAIITVLVLFVACGGYAQKKGKKSTISEGTVVTGNITAVSDFDIYGELKGNFSSEAALVVGETAKINGAITASTVTMKGSYEGDLTVSGLLSVEEQASVKGKANVGLLSVKEGAVYSVTTIMPERGDREDAKKKKTKEE